VGAHRAKVEQAVHEGGNYLSQYRQVRKDGAVVRLEERGHAVRDETGRTTRLVGVTVDITERKRVEADLRTATEQLQIVTESMSAPVTRCGRDLRYLWVSKSCAEWIGRPAAEIIGRPILDILGPEAFAHLRPRFEQVLSGRVVRYEEQVPYRTIGPRWINAVYTPTLDSQGVPDGWVAVVLDVTERKRLEEELRQKAKQLAEADHLKDEFLATLAHEL
jgi:PAS domain S-box-containing protein